MIKQFIGVDGKLLRDGTALVSPNYVYPTSGLMGRYTFEDNLEDAEWSGYPWVATNPGGVDYGDGKVGKALRKDGEFTISSNGYYVAKMLAQLPYSFAFWIKAPLSAPSAGKIIEYIGGSVGSRYDIYIETGGDTSNKAVFVRGQQSGNYDMVISDVDIYDNTWHHVVGTYDSTTLRLYIDGSLQSDTNSDNRLSMSFPNPTGTIMYLNALSTPVSPWLDQLYIYSRALSQLEVNILYNANHGI